MGNAKELFSSQDVAQIAQQREQRAAGAAAGAMADLADKMILPAGGDVSSNQKSFARLMNFSMTRAFDPGWRPPKPWFIPLGDPVRAAEKGRV